MQSETQILKQKMSKKDMFITIIMMCTAVLVTVAGVYYKQGFLRILPLYVSLIIGSLQSRVNRYSNLLGSVNSLLYGAVYFYYNLYGSALSAVFFSFPIQMITFIRWSKNKSGHSTVLRRMSKKQLIVLILAYAVALAALWVLLPLIGSEYVFLDSATTLLGILIYFLTMFAFVEYTYFMLINGVINIALYISMLGDSPETMSYFIFSIYSFICVAFASFEAQRLYKQQQLN